MRMEMVKGPLAEAWGMIRSDFWPISTTMLKLALIALLVIAAALVSAAAAGWALWSASPLAAIAIGAALAVVGLYLASVVGSVNYNFIDARSGKRRIDFSGSMGDNAVPMLWFDIANSLIFVVIAAPFMVLIFMLVASSGAGGLQTAVAEFLIRIGLTAVSAVVSFVIQFTIFELVVARKGILESFGRSLRIVRRYPLESVAFSVVIWAVESVIAIPFTIIFVALAFGALFALPSFGYTALIVAGIACAALVAVMAALTNTVSITARYKYWMRARKAG